MPITISWASFLEIVEGFASSTSGYANQIINFMFTPLEDVPFIGDVTPFYFLFSTGIVSLLIFRVAKFFVDF